MSEKLEKILGEIEENKHIVEIFGRGVYFVPLEATKQIIRKHMNDGWIPVERKTPPTGERLQAKIKHHEWIADYDNDWVPEEERTRHPEYTEICEIVCVDGIWRYMCKRGWI